MIAKALLNLDRVVYTLDPNFDPNSIIRERANEILQRNILKSIAPNNLLSGVVDLKEFAEKLPTRVNRILDAAGNNELRFKVDAIDEKVVLEGLQKVANRITLGLVVAALDRWRRDADACRDVVSDLWVSGVGDDLFSAGGCGRSRSCFQYSFLRREASQETLDQLLFCCCYQISSEAAISSSLSEVKDNPNPTPG